MLSPPAALWLLGANALLGCNAMLGIDAPKDTPLTETNDASQGGNGDLVDAGSEPAPQISEEDPSPYAWAAWRMPNPASTD